MMTAWFARLYSSMAASMRSSKRSGEFTLISEIVTGAASIASRPPCRISLIAIVSAAFGPDVTEPMCGLSESVCSANTMSRWRESSGVSFGSQIVPPAESSCSNCCESMTKRSKSAIVASRRSSPSRTNGGPYTPVNTMLSPPMRTDRSGLRATRSNSRGTLATCSITKSGSRKTVASSVRQPAARKISTHSGRMNSTPISDTIRRQPRSSVSMASSERIS